MSKQRVYLNSCDLLIDSAIIYKNLPETQLYFVWKKGKKFNKSNTYQPQTNSTLHIREKLELSLKIYSTNGKPDMKNTHLYIIAINPTKKTQRQLSSFILGVHTWNLNYQKTQLQIKQQDKTIGLVNIQVRKKQVMQLDNFQKYSAQIEQSSQEQSSIAVLNTSRKMIGTQLIQLQKQVQDLTYLNEKLKKDRSFLLIRNQAIQKEIKNIKSIFEQQLRRMQQHFDKKLAIRTSVYQQQIQSLITTFNQTSSTNSIIMKSIINQNQALAAQITQLRVISQQQLQKQQIHYKQKIAELHEQRDNLQDHVQQLQVKIQNFEKQINEINKKYDITKQQLDNITLNYEIDRKQHKNICEEYQKSIQTLRKQISDYKNKLAQKMQQLQKQKQAHEQLIEEHEQLRLSFEQSKVQRIKLQAQLQDKTEILETLKIQREQQQEIMKKFQSDYKFYIQESQRKGIEYQKQLQQLQFYSKQKQAQFQRILTEQKQRYYTQNLKVLEVTTKLQDYQKGLIIKDQQIKTFIDENAKLNEQYLEENKRNYQYQQQMRDLIQQAQRERINYQAAQAKVTLLTEEIDILERKNKEDLQNLKDHFQDSMKSREKYYDEQVQILKVKLEQSQTQYLKLTNDFRMQIQSYKDQMSKLQVQNLNQFTQLNQIIANSKRIEIECEQYKVLLEQAKQTLRQREKSYQQSIKLMLSNSQGTRSPEKKKEIQRDEADDLQISNSLKFSNQKFLDPKRLSVKVPQLGLSNMLDQQQVQYLKQIQNLGGIDHIKYIIQINKQNIKQIQFLQKQKNDLQTECQNYCEMMAKNNEQIKDLKFQLNNIQQFVEQLKQQLRYYLQKQELQQQQNQVKSKHSVPVKQQVQENIRGSYPRSQEMNKLKIFSEKSVDSNTFRSKQIKQRQKEVYQEKQKDKNKDKEIQKQKYKVKEKDRLSQKQKQIQDKELKLSRSVSRSSRGILLLKGKDQEVQVEIITLQEIQNYKKQISTLKSYKQNPPQPTNTKNQLIPKQQNKKQQKLNKSQSIQSILPVPQKQNKEIAVLQRYNSELLKRIQQFQYQIQTKQFKIDKLESRNRQILEQLNNIKQQMGMKISMQQSKLLQYSQFTKKDDEQYHKLKNTIFQKQRQVKQLQYNSNLQINKINYQRQQLQNQVKKFKKQVQDLQEKSKKTIAYQYTRIIQQDIEDANKKIIQLSRTINQLRMQKQSAEDELKMAKKKQSDLQKNIHNLTQKKSAAEQQNQVLNRKFNKMKRDLQQKQQQLKKVKQLYKRLQQQIASYSSLSSQTILQRKRNLQQKLQMQQQLNKRQAQIRRLNKQIQKNVQIISKNEDYSKDKTKTNTKQIQRLQNQCIKLRKLNIQLQEQNTYLANKLAVVQQQNRIKIQQMKASYKQKLNTLFTEISDIKQILASKDEEIHQIQSQKAGMKEQLLSYTEYISRIQQVKNKIEGEKQLFEEQIISLEENLLQINNQLTHYQQDNINLHKKIASLEEELSKQRMISVRKTQRSQQYQMLSQKYLYQLKNLKVQLNQHEKKQKAQQNLQKQLQQLQTQNDQIKQNYAILNRQYQNYKTMFVYTKEQVQELATQLKEGYEQIRKKQLADTLDQLDHQYQEKNLKRQKQIIELYNQNAKNKIQIQKKQDQNSQLLQKYSQIQAYPLKYRQLKDQYDNIMAQASYLKQQLAHSKLKLQKNQTTIKQLQRIISNLNHEIGLVNNSLANQKSKCNRLEQELLESQTGYSILKDEIKKVGSRSLQKSQNQTNLIQNYQQKILSVELQNMRIKQREQNMHRQYKQQIKKSETKIKQAMSQMQQKYVQMQRQYKGKLSQKDRLLKQSNRTLNSISADFKNIEQQFSTIKTQNDELSTQLANARLQMCEDEEIYICEINKLKNKMKEMQQIYNYNINTLQQQLAQLNKQLTMEKLNRQNGIGASRLRQSEVDKRMQQKLKMKDMRIEQLKKNIYLLEQTVMNLKKKQQHINDEFPEGSGSKYRSLYYELQQQIQLLNKKKIQQSQLHDQIQKQLRQQITKIKQNEQNISLLLDRQTLELQSTKSQLNTIKQVYQTLQRQLQKRQIKLTQNIGVQSYHQKQIDQKNNRIHQLEDINKHMKNEYEQLLIKIKNKDHQLNQINQKLIKQTKLANRNKVNIGEQKKVSFLQLQNQKSRAEIQQLKAQNKRLINQIDILKNDLIKARSKKTDLQIQANRLARQHSQMMQKLFESQEIVGKYMTVNSKSKQNHGVGVQELVIGGFLEEKMFDQDQEINQLKQEVQQMKFNEDRRNLDFEQLKKQKFQLILKVEDYELISQQVQNLRSICDKLEEQKKIAIFREQAIKIRLANLIRRNQAQESIKDGIQAILNYNVDIFT